MKNRVFQACYSVSPEEQTRQETQLGELLLFYYKSAMAEPCKCESSFLSPISFTSQETRHSFSESLVLSIIKLQPMLFLTSLFPQLYLFSPVYQVISTYCILIYCSFHIPQFFRGLKSWRMLRNIYTLFESGQKQVQRTSWGQREFKVDNTVMNQCSLYVYVLCQLFCEWASPFNRHCITMLRTCFPNSKSAHHPIMAWDLCLFKHKSH